MPSLPSWLRAPRVRRGLAASAVVLATGGLVLLRAPASAHDLTDVTAHAGGPNSVAFAGPGAHGTLSVSQTRVLQGQSVFAELRLAASDAEHGARERAPLAMVVVLDTSGSMEGEKIGRAKEAVARLVGEMRDDDEVALVRYASDSEVLQHLTTVRHAREQGYASRLSGIYASGGTNIPLGLSTGLRELAGASSGRVRRVVLVSDGLDSTRVESERLAADSFGRGIEVSSLGIGLDFDEAYMGGVARAGHGNFAFAKDGSAIASFLHQELDETAATVVENATAQVTLPRGMRFLRAIGADAKTSTFGGEVDLAMGSLFAGDERRVILQFASDLADGDARDLATSVSWTRVGGERADVKVPDLAIVGTRDAEAAAASTDSSILASATSVVASTRELEATEAYAAGDQAKAQALIQQNVNDLRHAAVAAPAPVASQLQLQLDDYARTESLVTSLPPASSAGKSLAKSSAAKDFANVARPAATVFAK